MVQVVLLTVVPPIVMHEWRLCPRGWVAQAKNRTFSPKLPLLLCATCTASNCRAPRCGKEDKRSIDMKIWSYTFAGEGVCSTQSILFMMLLLNIVDYSYIMHNRTLTSIHMPESRLFPKWNISCSHATRWTTWPKHSFGSCAGGVHSRQHWRVKDAARTNTA